MKRLQSEDRTRALAGIKNAAWDLTHLSIFIEKIRDEESHNKRFIFATLDKGLANITRLLFEISQNDETPAAYAQVMSAWWPERDAEKIASQMMATHAAVTDSSGQYPLRPADHIDVLIHAGESAILGHSSK